MSRRHCKCDKCDKCCCKCEKAERREVNLFEVEGQELICQKISLTDNENVRPIDILNIKVEGMRTRCDVSSCHGYVFVEGIVKKNITYSYVLANQNPCFRPCTDEGAGCNSNCPCLALDTRVGNVAVWIPFCLKIKVCDDNGFDRATIADIEVTDCFDEDNIIREEDPILESDLGFEIYPIRLICEKDLVKVRVILERTRD